MAERGITPSQTVGPFFATCLTPEVLGGTGIATGDAVTPDAIGTSIRVRGRVLDGAGEPVPDALVETWQADGEGRFPAPGGNTGFRGFARAATDVDGRFVLRTVRPGPVPGPEGRAQAPHIAVSVFARGLLQRLATRIYFADEPANAADPVLALVPPERRATLLAAREKAIEAEPAYAFTIRLQGPRETVFLEI